MALQATRTIGGGDGWDRTESGIYLPDWANLDGIATPVLTVPGRQPIGIDLFAGAGGFSCGFKQAGWHVIAASEAWHTAAITYLLNLGAPETVVHVLAPIDGDSDLRVRDRRLHERYTGEAITARQLFDWHADGSGDAKRPGEGWIANQPGVQPCQHLYLGDVRHVTGQRILDDLGLSGDEVGCVFGGPPCQGFSRAGKRQPDDPRNELVFEFMRVVCEIHPRSFCMENVPGLLDMITRDGIPVIDALALMAQEGGMGTFHAIRRSLAETAGAGAALRTMTASASRRQPAPGVCANGHVDLDDEQLQLFASSS